MKLRKITKAEYLSFFEKLNDERHLSYRDFRVLSFRQMMKSLIWAILRLMPQNEDRA